LFVIIDVDRRASLAMTKEWIASSGCALLAMTRGGGLAMTTKKWIAAALRASQRHKDHGSPRAFGPRDDAVQIKEQSGEDPISKRSWR
jgi:hypothetical protein